MAAPVSRELQKAEQYRAAGLIAQTKYALRPFVDGWPAQWGRVCQRLQH
jgi:hypothetical protein